MWAISWWTVIKSFIVTLVHIFILYNFIFIFVSYLIIDLEHENYFFFFLHNNFEYNLPIVYSITKVPSWSLTDQGSIAWIFDYATSPKFWWQCAQIERQEKFFSNFEHVNRKKALSTRALINAKSIQMFLIMYIINYCNVVEVEQLFLQKQLKDREKNYYK